MLRITYDTYCEVQLRYGTLVIDGDSAWLCSPAHAVSQLLVGPHVQVFMAVKLDISVLLEAVGAEDYTKKLADNGVVTIEQCAALTEERLKECGIPRYSEVRDAIRKAKELLSSRDDVVQQELLVSGTSLG